MKGTQLMVSKGESWVLGKLMNDRFHHLNPLLSCGFISWYFCGYWVSAKIYSLSYLHWWLNPAGFLTCALVAIALLATCFRRQRFSSKLLSWIATLAIVGSLVSLALIDGAEDLASVVIILSFFSAGQVWMMFCWSGEYSRVSTKQAIGSILLGTIFISLLKAVMSISSPEVMTALTCVISVVSAVSLYKVSTDEHSQEKADLWFKKRLFLSFWRIACAAAALFFIWSMLNIMLKSSTGHFNLSGGSAVYQVLLSQLIVIVFSLGTLFWVFIQKGSMDINQICRFAYVLVALSLFLFTAIGIVQIIQVFVSAAFGVALAFVFMTQTNIARHSSLKPYIVFCIGSLLYSMPDWLGRSMVNSGLVVSMDIFTISLVFFFIVLIVAFFLPSRFSDAQFLFSDINGATTTPQEGSMGVDAACEAIGQENKLSTREIEILQYLCKGRSKPYIAETLYLSENTVRTYTRRIYVKLNVHNRQELLDMISS
jgi:DNA-binding CsgD family transcriptional regulator